MSNAPLVWRHRLFLLPQGGILLPEGGSPVVPRRQVGDGKAADFLSKVAGLRCVNGRFGYRKRAVYGQ